jgi:hypothetical protein
MPPKRQAQRTLIDGLSRAQDELLRKVQYRQGVLAGRDTLYLAVRDHLDRSNEQVAQPTKRQVGTWLKAEKGYQRQQTTGAALPKHKPVNIIRRSAPLQYLQGDVFQLDEREIRPTVNVTYTNKKGNRVTVPLVNKFAVIVVDAFSKLIWVRLLRTPKGAGVAAAWTGLKRNPEVIGTAKALDSVFTEIDADLQDETPTRRLRDLGLKFGSDNGNEFVSPDIERVMTKFRVKHEYGIKGRPMSQALAESHVGVWKRRFATYVRTRMAAVNEDDEESRRAKEIKASWPDLADTITASVNTAWMEQHPRPLSRHDVHYGDAALIQRVKEHQSAKAGKRAKAYEQDNQPKYKVGDIVRRRVARSGKLDAAWSKRLYRIVNVLQYTKAKRPAGYKLAPLAAPNQREPGYYRAEALQTVLVRNNVPVQNQLSQADADALADPDRREYQPWRILDRQGNRVLVQWRGYPRSDATWEDITDVPSLA